MSLLQSISDAVNRAVEKLLLLIGASICLILFAQVVFRYAGASLGWSEEVSRHLLVAITFLGGTAAYKRASFIGLKGIGHRLGPGIQRGITLALQLLTLALFLVVVWFGAAYTLKAWQHTSAALLIPMAIPFAVIPVSAVVFVVHVLSDLTQTLARKRP
ncbi:MAG: TRAP transporter small permease subunit [Desulfobacterales bacterium]|jgi:TRAP-type C4-dicarboxylate transport system permease small subunit|nr:TRAP transporter small permease subunit [Desulfobacterales bacterium]MCU0585861.1 TRAP transporter small permease subunit [Desulfobacterales bacterium]